MNAPLTSTNLANPFDRWFQPVESVGCSLMDHLFNRLDGLYPDKWKRSFPNQTAIDNWMVAWAEAFEDEQVTPAMVKLGLKACRTKFEWPPSCAEFVRACKPAVDATVAYYEAVAGCQAREKGEVGTWSHPAVYWAAVAVSTFDLKSQTYSQIKGRWERSLAEQMAKTEWEPIPMPALALPAPGKSETSREQAKAMLQQLGATGIVKSATGRDEKRWAKVILQREADGDKTLTPLQVRFAREALNTAMA